MEIFQISNSFNLSYYDIFNIWYYSPEIEKQGYNDKHLLILGYMALSKDKYNKYIVECMQCIKTFKKIGDLPIKKFDIVTCARQWAKFLNQTKT